MLIQNPDVGQTLRDETKLQLAEVSNLNIAPNVQAVIDVSKKTVEIIGSASRSTTGSSTLLPSDTEKSTYVCGILISGSCDATADITEFWIGGTVNGVASTRVVSMQKTTLTAFERTVYIPFDKPLVFNPGTTLALNITFTVGTAVIRGILYGFRR